MKIDACAAVANPANYYDGRHDAGWMDFWPDYKKRRVIELVGASLEPTAVVLEYGCGAGVFTSALKRARPSLNVYGCDISTVALAKARRRCPEVEFYCTDDPALDRLEGKVDMIYTHHVLEHVSDLPSVLEHITRLLKPGGKVLHVAPCANPDSLEYRISCCVQSRPDENGRFSLDDSSHLRRLTSAQLAALSKVAGLAMEQELYANQFWGGLDYLTNQYHRILISWLNPFEGVDLRAKARLLGWLSILLPTHIASKGPNYVFAHVWEPMPALKKGLFLGVLPVAVSGWPISVGLDRLIQWAREMEWKHRKDAPNGSEMYCIYKKPIQ